MELPQLIYGSAGHGPVRGYQLLGRSSSVPESTSRAFCRWAPSHGSLQSNAADASSLSFFAVEQNTWAIARSVHGGPEYSGRGLEVVTIALLVNAAQLHQYDNQPTQLIRMALALGHLTLPTTSRTALPAAVLPQHPIELNCIEPLRDNVRQTADLAEAGQKVCVLSCQDPLGFLQQVFCQLTYESRPSVSFTTGLKQSVQREVNIQFLKDADFIAINKLNRQNFTCIRALATSSI